MYGRAKNDLPGETKNAPPPPFSQLISRIQSGVGRKIMLRHALPLHCLFFFQEASVRNLFIYEIFHGPSFSLLSSSLRKREVMVDFSPLPPPCTRQLPRNELGADTQKEIFLARLGRSFSFVAHSAFCCCHYCSPFLLPFVMSFAHFV